jgi:hypothetical protein
MLEARADKQWGDQDEYKKYKSQVPTLLIKFWK